MGFFTCLRYLCTLQSMNWSYFAFSISFSLFSHTQHIVASSKGNQSRYFDEKGNDCDHLQSFSPGRERIVSFPITLPSSWHLNFVDADVLCLNWKHIDIHTCLPTSLTRNEPRTPQYHYILSHPIPRCGPAPIHSLSRERLKRALMV